MRLMPHIIRLRSPDVSTVAPERNAGEEFIEHLGNDEGRMVEPFELIRKSYAGIDPREWPPHFATASLERIFA